MVGIFEGRPDRVTVVGEFCCHGPDNALDRGWGIGEIDGMAVECAEADLVFRWFLRPPLQRFDDDSAILVTTHASTRS